jgi:hypothetical protein
VVAEDPKCGSCEQEMKQNFELMDSDDLLRQMNKMKDIYGDLEEVPDFRLAEYK